MSKTLTLSDAALEELDGDVVPSITLTLVGRNNAELLTVRLANDGRAKIVGVSHGEENAATLVRLLRALADEIDEAMKPEGGGDYL